MRQGRRHMSRNDPNSALETIIKIREKIAITIGSIITVMLCVYLFTYSSLLYSSLSYLFWVEAISLIPMIVTLFYLKSVSFFLTRLWLGRRPGCREVLASMTLSDLQ